MLYLRIRTVAEYIQHTNRLRLLVFGGAGSESGGCGGFSIEVDKLKAEVPEMMPT